MSKLLNKFAKEYGMGSNDHEITGGKLSQISKNATKLTGVFVKHGILSFLCNHHFEIQDGGHLLPLTYI